MKTIIVIVILSTLLAVMGGCATTCVQSDNACLDKQNKVAAEEFQRFMERDTLAR